VIAATVLSLFNTDKTITLEKAVVLVSKETATFFLHKNIFASIDD
jgi:hypothetical protein